MARSISFHSHMTSQRDCRWYLEQDDDDTLHVLFEDDDNPDIKSRMPVNDFLIRGDATARQSLMKLIDRMFEDREQSNR